MLSTKVNAGVIWQSEAAQAGDGNVQLAPEEKLFLWRWLWGRQEISYFLLHIHQNKNSLSIPSDSRGSIEATAACTVSLVLTLQWISGVLSANKRSQMFFFFLILQPLSCFISLQVPYLKE